MNENNAAQNVQTSLATDTISVDASRLEEKSKMQKKYRRLSVMLVGVIVVAVVALLLLQFDPWHPRQIEWSEWMEALPEYATERFYNIEERVLYRTRSLETITSTTQSEMDGWEQYDSFDNPAAVGNWSTWSESPIVATETLEVETTHEYRSRVKETTSSTSPNKDGWIQYASEDNYSYGQWGEWSDMKISSSSTTEVQAATWYHYPAEIFHDGKFYGTCTINSTNGEYQVGHKTDDYIVTDYEPLYGVHRQIFIAGAVESTSTRYRARTKTLTTTYYFYRWTAWNDWSSNPISSTSDIEVQERNLYRSREVQGDTIYCFRRWNDWSDYRETPVSASDTLEVETITQYRFKSKDS